MERFLSLNNKVNYLFYISLFDNLFSDGWCWKGAHFGNEVLIYKVKYLPQEHNQTKKVLYSCQKGWCSYKGNTKVTNGEGVTKNGFKDHLKHPDAHNYKEVKFDTRTKLIASIECHPQVSFDDDLEQKELVDMFGQHYHQHLQQMQVLSKLTILVSKTLPKLR